MDMLPPDARPSNDREGQQKRARRRLHQLPLHDMDASACSNIDQDAMKELETFVNERDNKDIAKGDVAEEVELKVRRVLKLSTSCLCYWHIHVFRSCETGTEWEIFPNFIHYNAC